MIAEASQRGRPLAGLCGQKKPLTIGLVYRIDIHVTIEQRRSSDDTGAYRALKM